MPTYEYACQKCYHAFEIFQSMRDEPLKKCPSCKKPALKRLVGAGAGLIFKGSGFYITDYKNQSRGKAEGGGKGEAGGKSEAAGGGPKGGEAKPDAGKSSSESKPASDSKAAGPKSSSTGQNS